MRSAGQFVPPSLEGTVIFPGFDGGGEWGGVAFDPASGLLYVNANEMPWILRLVESPRNRESMGRGLYESRCAACHRQDRKGSPPEFPSLDQIATRRTREQIVAMIHDGGGRMPAFAQLRPDAVSAIITYVTTGEDVAVTGVAPSPWPIEQKRNTGTTATTNFWIPDGYPAVETAVGNAQRHRSESGDDRVEDPFRRTSRVGRRRDCGIQAARITADPWSLPEVCSSSPPPTTIASFTPSIKPPGELLWETTLPAAGNATPAVYEVNGRQFVVVAAGGGKSGAPSGGSYVAFALPKN